MGENLVRMLLHDRPNIFVRVLFDPQTVRICLIGLWTTEFGAGLALIAVVVANILYSEHGELLEERFRKGFSSTICPVT